MRLTKPRVGMNFGKLGKVFEGRYGRVCDGDWMFASKLIRIAQIRQHVTTSVQILKCLQIETQTLLTQLQFFQCRLVKNENHWQLWVGDHGCVSVAERIDREEHKLWLLVSDHRTGTSGGCSIGVVVKNVIAN